MSAHLSRRLLLALLLVVPLLVFGGAANAYWRAAGAGTGSGAAATTTPVTLSAGSPTANLYPGGSANVMLTVTNSNSSAVHISTLSLATTQGTGGFSVDAGHSGCAVATLSFTTQTNGGAGWNIAAKVGAVDGTLAVTLTNALAMGIGAANACQGATAAVYLTASP